jgi:uncharacterized protein (TIGR02099 family)
MIKKSLIWSYRVAYIALGTFAFLSLLSIIVLRYFILPHIDDYKPKIVQGLSQVLGQKVTIGNIYANWDSLNPHLSIFNVDIYDKENRVALSLRHIEGSLSWTSIPLFEPRLASFSIYQPELTIRREKDGTVYVAGVSMSGPSQPEFPNWLLRQAKVNVVDANIVWQDELRGAPPLNLNMLNLQLENPAWDSIRGRHEFSVRATPSAATSKPIDIRGKVFGKDVSQITQWDGIVYAKIEGTDIAAWRNWLDYPIDLHEGHGAAQFWVDFADNHIEGFTTDVALDKVVTRLPYNGLENSFNRIAGRLKWIHHKDGQEIKGEGIKIVTSDDLNMRSGKFSVRERTNHEVKTVEGDVLLDEIQLETLDKLTPYFKLPSNVDQALKETGPLGKLSKLRLTWLSKGESLPEYALHADFNGLTVHPYTKYALPGFSNLTGKIEVNQNQGRLILDSKLATLHFTPVLRWAIPVEKLTGQIDWKVKNKNLTVDVNSLAIKSEHLTGEVDAIYISDGAQKQYLDLTGHATNVDLKYGRFYYPNRISKDTMAWLDKSILSGRGEDVNVRIKGDLKDYPFADGKKGTFKVTGDIKDGALDYTDGWPKIEGIKLAMLFEGKRMELNASAGHLLGNEIKKAKITIPDLEVDDNLLDIAGETQGPVSEMVKFINASPIEKLANGFTESLKTAGTGKLNLNLHIPLLHSEATKIKGTYVVTNGSMLADSIPDLTKINGTVDFTESSINASNVNTWAYGAPATFSINTDKNHAIQIAAQGRVTDAGLRQAFSNAVPNSLTGSADWSAKAQIVNKQSEVSIRSNLIGIGAKLPAPFGKATTDAMPLLIEKKPISETQDAIQVTLGNVIGAKFIRTAQNGITKIERGDIGINILPELNNQKGVSIHANLDSLDIDEWLEQMDQSSNNTSSAIAINSIELTTHHLDLFDRRLNSLKINAKSSDNAWIMNIKSNEITGDLKWSQEGNGKISGNLSNLIFPSPTSDAVKKPTNTVAKQLNIKYPALDIAADNFEIGKKKLGRLELQAKEQFGNWGIDKLRLTTADGVINANGEWNNWKKRPNTKLRFNWEISDMGKALKRLDFGDVIKGGTAEITGQLKWAGSPHEFDIPNLSGSLHLDAKKGQIVQVEPGVGRLFSVLSLQNLPRRLTLDFKDLFSSGFTFDKITADVNIERGILFSDNFKMDGPTAKVEIKGETDLDKETQHLYIKAKPYISDTLSLAAFAGGPAVGAAAYIAQKILKDPLNKIAETQYEIVGTWNDPQEKDSKPTQVEKNAGPLGK